MRNSRYESVLANIRTFIAFRNDHAAWGGNYCSVTLQVKPAWSGIFQNYLRSSDWLPAWMPIA